MRDIYLAVSQANVVRRTPASLLGGWKVNTAAKTHTRALTHINEAQTAALQAHYALRRCSSARPPQEGAVRQCSGLLIASLMSVSPGVLGSGCAWKRV